MSERHRTEPRLEAFVEGMGMGMRSIFGKNLPGVIATITNVTFPKVDLNRDRVRAILETRQPNEQAGGTDSV